MSIHEGMDTAARMKWFRDRCEKAGLPCTHQRQILYRALLDAEDHPSPEALYERVKRDIPSISLGTVYRNIKIFLDHGLIGEVSLHHGSLRLEANNLPHHHLVCRYCRKIFDLPLDEVGDIRLRHAVPEGFAVERFVVEGHGVCAGCTARDAKTIHTGVTHS